MVGFHLLGKVFFEHCLLVYPVKYELHRCLLGYLHRRLAILRAVEPCLCPPSDASLVGIDGDEPLYVETLYIYLQIGERVDNPCCGYGFVKSFFLLAASSVDRNIWWRRAR